MPSKLTTYFAMFATAASAVPGIAAVRGGLWFPKSDKMLYDGLSVAAGAAAILVVLTMKHVHQDLTAGRASRWCIAWMTIGVGICLGHTVAKENCIFKDDFSEVAWFPLWVTGGLAQEVATFGSRAAVTAKLGAQQVNDAVQGTLAMDFTKVLFLSLYLLAVTSLTSGISILIVRLTKFSATQDA